MPNNPRFFYTSHNNPPQPAANNNQNAENNGLIMLFLLLRILAPRNLNLPPLHVHPFEHLIDLRRIEPRANDRPRRGRPVNAAANPIIYRRNHLRRNHRQNRRANPSTNSLSQLFFLPSPLP